MTPPSTVHAAEELPVVAALRSLSVFSADQSGAYREHFAMLAAVLGEDVKTRLGRYVNRWVASGNPGAVVLTGNAGTGKTAVAQVYCEAVGAELPQSDGPSEVATSRWVVKDLSGMPNPDAREEALLRVLDAGQTGQALVCANEGVLRDALGTLRHHCVDLATALEPALRHGADRSGLVTVVNLNRQRPTADGLWQQLLDYLTREELWTGCRDCPFEVGGCPMRSNAEQLRHSHVREQLRALIRLATGEAVPTLREVLAILSWAIVGGYSCMEVKGKVRDLGMEAFTASQSYFTRVVGGGLRAEAIERSPLLWGMRRAGLGEVSDLEIDGWLRDTTGAPHAVRMLAGDPAVALRHADEMPVGGRRPGLAGTRSPLDRVRTNQGAMTFHALGEMVSTDEDPTRVEDGLDALVIGRITDAPAQALWRQRMYFEASVELGGPPGTARRLLDYRHLHDLMALAHTAAEGGDTILALTDLVRGLNFLVTGFSSTSEGLIVPDPACLFARDPGSFRLARPSLVHSQVAFERLTVALPDRGLVDELLDVDHIEVDIVVDADPALSLRIRPRMYEAIREAAEFQGPVGQGAAEMNDLRGFYGRLAAAELPDGSLRVADPDSWPPSLIKVSLPYLAGGSV